MILPTLINIPSEEKNNHLARSTMLNKKKLLGTYRNYNYENNTNYNL